MGKLIYSAIASLDGYVATRTFDRAEPDEEVRTGLNPDVTARAGRQRG